MTREYYTVDVSASGYWVVTWCGNPRPIASGYGMDAAHSEQQARVWIDRDKAEREAHYPNDGFVKRFQVRA